MRHTNAILGLRDPIDTRSDPLQVYPVLARFSTESMKRPFCVIRLVDVSQDLTTGLKSKLVSNDPSQTETNYSRAFVEPPRGP